MAGDTLVAGSNYGDDDLGVSVGSAFVYQRDFGGADAWGEVAKLTADDGEEFDFFGETVAIADDTVAIGATEDDGSGSAYVFGRDAGGPDAWGQVAKMAPRDGRPDDKFGSAIATRGDTIAIGSPWDDDHATQSGATYVFRQNSGGPDAWGQIAKITPDDGFHHDHFGTALAVVDDLIVIGTSGDNNGAEDRGSAYIYGETTIDLQLEISGRCPGDLTVAASGATPDGDMQLWAGFELGSFTLETGICMRLDLGLEGPKRLRIGEANEDGTKIETHTASEAQCGALLRLIDMTTCTTSQLLQSP